MKKLTKAQRIEAIRKNIEDSLPIPDYWHWHDNNVYPRDTVIYESETIRRVLVANEAGIVGIIDIDVELTRYEQQKDQADQVIADYAKIGRDALWAYGKGGGFRLKATDTQPAKYVSMQQAKAEIASIPEPRDSEGYTAVVDPLYLKSDVANCDTSEPRLSDTTDWPAFDLDYLPGVIQYDRAVADSGYHGSYRSGIMEPGRPMSSYDQLYTAADPVSQIASSDENKPAQLSLF